MGFKAQNFNPTCLVPRAAGRLQTLASFRSGICYGSFLPTLRFGNDVLCAGVCWPQQDLGEGIGMAPSCLRQTAASAERGSDRCQGQKGSVCLVPRETEGDTGAQAG